MSNTERTIESFGHLLGYASGNVAAYSSDYDTASQHEYPKRSAYRSYYHGIYMGYKWQCVEFARRWMYINKGYIFDDVAMAYDIFNLRSVRNVAANTRLAFNAFANGSKQHPQVGCLLIWDEGGEFEVTGHVAVVTEVSEHFVRVAEQNVGHLSWEGRNYARELKATVTPEGEYWLECSYGDAAILGWMIQTDDDTYAEPKPEHNAALFCVKSAHADPKSMLKKSWLNMANADEAAFVNVMGGHYLTQLTEQQTRYFVLSKSAELALEQATNELHGLFMHATEYVLANDDLLAQFNIPKAVIPKIRKSWDNRLNELITSRFDFTLSEQGLKVYEYNCDSASCYMEAGKVQGKWSQHYRVFDGEDAGKSLLHDLAKTWRKSKAQDVVHILRDDEPEEMYHALFMKEAIEAGGLRCKIIVGLQGLNWDDKGNILDVDGEPLKWVWKTWSWETALDQIRSECEDAADAIYEPRWQTAKNLRLSDVLLRENIMVFEPIWSLIPSNKAILPVLWSLFPNHPLLLNAAFELNDDLQASGYVVKPIVGRCGSNIQLFDKNKALLESTNGHFSEQNTIYQQFFPLPLVDQYYTQVSTFSAAGVYSGSGVRVDTSRVINQHSDCMALRFIDDKLFLNDY